jgi:hypothetical protein
MDSPEVLGIEVQNQLSVPKVIMLPWWKAEIAHSGARRLQGAQCKFLETTMIGSADLDAVQQAAQARYEDVLAKGYFSRGLFDLGGFARLIDVVACRVKGIAPLE